MTYWWGIFVNSLKDSRRKKLYQIGDWLWVTDLLIGDPNFSPKLFLDVSELTLIKNSFSEAILDQLSVTLNKSKTHNDFQDGLQLAITHNYLLQGNSEKKLWLSSLPWKDQFSRFMRLKPETRNDEKLFLSIIEFLSKLSNSSEFDDIIKAGVHTNRLILF